MSYHAIIKIGLMNELIVDKLYPMDKKNRLIIKIFLILILKKKKRFYTTKNNENKKYYCIFFIIFTSDFSLIPISNTFVII